MEKLDTLPKLMKRNFEKYGEQRVAVRRKDFGIWNEYTWADSYDVVKHFSLGLVSLGLEPGDKVTIIGDNAPEGYWAEYAAQAVRGAAVPVYTDAIPAELNHTVNHSDSKFVVAQDQEQVDKFLELKEDGKLPKVRKIIYWDAKGMWSYEEPILMDFYDVVELGRKYEKKHPGLFEKNVESGQGSDICLVLYTSGTSGALPKGVELSHKSLVESARAEIGIVPQFSSDDYVSYIAPAWITEQVHGAGEPMVTGATVDFVEEPETAQEDIREIAPQMLIFGSRLWESLASMVQSRITDTSAVKRWMYNVGMAVGYKIVDMRSAGQDISIFWQVLHAIVNLVVHRPLRDKLGLSKIRTTFTGGAMTAPDVLRFFQAIGVNLLNGYGLTELTPLTLHTANNVMAESIGIPVPGIDVRISDAGEIIYRSERSFCDYYKDPEETQKTIDSEGWVHTGDGGYINDYGHVVFLDRVKDLVPLKTGEKFAPQFVESILRFNPYIQDAMLIAGSDKDYITAIIVIDYGNVGRWAEKRNIAYTTYTDLSQKPQTCELITNVVNKINSRLPEHYRIRRFLNFHKEFDPDEAELTRTRKLRRSFMEERYGELVDALYSNAGEVALELDVTYQDGRKAKVSANVKINEVKGAE
jgi:long-chain acyl-CoA synthetase